MYCSYPEEVAVNAAEVAEMAVVPLVAESEEVGTAGVVVDRDSSLRASAIVVRRGPGSAAHSRCSPCL